MLQMPGVWRSVAKPYKPIAHDLPVAKLSLKRSKTMHLQAYLTKTISLAVLILGLSGCSIWGTTPYRNPDIHLLKVQVVKAKLVQQDFNLHFKVENPNDSRIFVRGMRYKIRLNEIMLADGKSSHWFFVPAHSQKTFVVPIRTNLWQHLKPLAKMLKKSDQPIHYQLEGKLKTGILFRNSVEIGRSGDITPGALAGDD